MKKKEIKYIEKTTEVAGFTLLRVFLVIGVMSIVTTIIYSYLSK